jgi:hypothetical protein
MVNEGETVTLHASGSTIDLGGNITTYHWNQLAGPPITLSDFSAVQSTFTAPDVGRGWGYLIFELTITTDEGLQVTDTVTITVLNAFIPGDIDDNGTVDLEDAILVFQIMAGTALSTTIYNRADVNHNGKIGSEEMIYILRDASVQNWPQMGQFPSI